MAKAREVKYLTFFSEDERDKFCLLSVGFIHFHINNFYVYRYHPFKGCYLYDITAMRIGNLISESL